jgi:hypothetical protein
MDAPNEEFRNYTFTLYADYRAGGSAKFLSMLQLLDKLDLEYTRIHNSGRWAPREDPQVLALTAALSTLQSKITTLQSQYVALQSQITKAPTPTPPPKEKIQKPPPRQANDPEITEFQGLVWKWCDKCHGGCWNRTHITSEHVPGKGKHNHQYQTPDNNKNNNTNNPSNNNNNNTTPPQANIAQIPSPSSNADPPSTPEANIATNNSYSLDFM